ncbi:hypothetical protein [Micromonospora sp. NPDC005173]|uniref:hypothetical protein n=1 Tax=Micromonospora sp. NPDC005173 TaxID=3157165 RepID=UPI0033A43B72
MTRIPRLAAVVILAAAVTGCGGDPEPAAAPSSTVAATSVSPSPSPSLSPSPSPSLSPSHKPTLPIEMTDEGGNCVSEGRCGYYVAGSSCKNVEWCKKSHLVEPGTWATDGGTGATDCMWGLSLPPEYGVDDGGYAIGPLEVAVPKGAIFSTRNCAAGWQWLHP